MDESISVIDEPVSTPPKKRRRIRREALVERCFSSEKRCRWTGIICSSLLFLVSIAVVSWPAEQDPIVTPGGGVIPWQEAVSLVSSSEHWTAAATTQRESLSQHRERHDAATACLAPARSVPQLIAALQEHARGHQIDLAVTDRSDRKSLNQLVVDELQCRVTGSAEAFLPWMSELSGPDLSTEVVNIEIGSGAKPDHLHATIRLRCVSLAGADEA